MSYSLRIALPCSAILLFATACRHSPALPEYGHVKRFELTSQTGQPFDSAQKLDGQVWIAAFIFTNCPGPCPRMGSQMRRVQQAVPELRMVSFTIDPDRDTPEVLNRYGVRFDADPARWHFLTGTKAALNDLSLKVFKLGEVDGSLEHQTKLVLVDRKGQIRGYYATDTTESVERLTADARSLVAAKGNASP